jgi:tyrosinase
MRRLISFPIHERDLAPRITQFSTSPYTIRQPPAYDTADPASVQAWQDGLSDNTQVETALNSGLQDNASRIYHLYAATRSYPSLATATVYGRPDTSLEAVHNNVHKEIGGSWGHMTVFDVAGFDPIFWMHHGSVLTAVTTSIADVTVCIFQ